MNRVLVAVLTLSAATYVPTTFAAEKTRRVGLIGAGLGQISQPLGMAFGFVGLARSVYANVFGKGRELHFQADTPIQVQLAPGRSADQ